GRFVVDEAVVLVKGQVRGRGSDIELTVEEIVPLGDTVPPPASIALPGGSGVPQGEVLRLRGLLFEHPGETPVTLEVRLPDRTVRIAARDNCKIAWSPELAAAIEEILGPGSVRELRGQAA